MSIYWVIALTILSIPFASYAQDKDAASSGRGTRLIDTLLKNNDRNKDGKIAKDEARQQLKQNFDRGGSELGYRQLTARCLDRILEAWPVNEESVKYFFTAKIQQLPVTSLLGKAA